MGLQVRCTTEDLGIRIPGTSGTVNNLSQTLDTEYPNPFQPKLHLFFSAGISHHSLGYSSLIGFGGVDPKINRCYGTAYRTDNSRRLRWHNASDLRFYSALTSGLFSDGVLSRRVEVNSIDLSTSTYSTTLKHLEYNFVNDSTTPSFDPDDAARQLINLQFAGADFYWSEVTSTARTTIGTTTLTFNINEVPKALLFLHAGSFTAPFNIGTSSLGFGFCDGSLNQRSFSFVNNSSFRSTSRIAISSDFAVQVTALAAGSATLNWTSVSGIAFPYTVIALYGANYSVASLSGNASLSLNHPRAAIVGTSTPILFGLGAASKPILLPNSSFTVSNQGFLSLINGGGWTDSSKLGIYSSASQTQSSPDSSITVTVDADSVDLTGNPDLDYLLIDAYDDGPVRLTNSYLEAITIPESKLRLTNSFLETITDPDPKARLSNFYLETLTANNSKARLSNFYVEVITPYIEPISHEFSDLLTFEQTIDYVHQLPSIEETLSDTLELSQDFTYAISSEGVQRLTIQHTFNLTQSISFSKISGTGSSQTARSIFDQLELTQDINVEAISDNPYIAHTLNLTQQIDYERIHLIQELQFSFNDFLEFEDEYSWTNSRVAMMRTRSLTDQLVFEETILYEYEHLYAFSDTLELTDSISRNQDLEFNFSDILVFKEPSFSRSLNYNTVVQIPTIIYQLEPANTSPHLLPTIRLRRDPFIVELPMPEFGNSYNLNNKIAVQRTMTGGTFTYVKPSKTQILNFDFTLTRSKRLELLQFLKDVAGDYLLLENWKNQLWIGHLVNPTFELDDFQTSLQFEGMRVQ